MASKTHSTTKRFGARYGWTVKEKLGKIEAMAKAKYKCPFCAATKVTKKTTGIWSCKKCGKTFTGKAYSARI